MDQKVIAFAIVGILVGAGIGIGAGYMFWSEGDEAEKYSFYLYFKANDARNGWYEAGGSNTLDAFDKAMKNAGFEWEKSSWGYIGMIDGEGSWSIVQYLYESTDSKAAESSVNSPYNDDYGYFRGSNGWSVAMGYDWPEGNEDMKIKQFCSKIYFLSVYGDVTENPTTIDTWKNSGPFAA